MIQENENSVDLYSTLITPLSKRKVAKTFKKAGWFVRKSGWYEYEIESEYAELEIYGGNEILMSGLVNDYKTTIPIIIAILQENSIAYQLECYDQNGNLLVEYK